MIIDDDSSAFFTIHHVLSTRRPHIVVGSQHFRPSSALVYTVSSLPVDRATCRILAPTYHYLVCLASGRPLPIRRIRAIIGLSPTLSRAEENVVKAVVLKEVPVFDVLRLCGLISGEVRYLVAPALLDRSWWICEWHVEYAFSLGSECKKMLALVPRFIFW